MAPRPIRETSSPLREMCFIRWLRSHFLGPLSRPGELSGSGGVVVGEVAGQFAVRTGLREEVGCLLLNGGDRVGAGREAPRWLVLAGELDQRVRELGGVTALSPGRPW